MTSAAVGTTDFGDPITLSEVEFDVVWEHLGFDETPLILRVPSPGKTFEERDKIVGRVWRQLGAMGLGQPNNIHPVLADRLSILVRPEREVDARLWLGKHVRAIAAARDGRAVLATLSDGLVRFYDAHATGLPRFILGLLPQLPAGPGRSVTLRTSDLEQAAEAKSNLDFEQQLRGRGVRADDVEALMTMFAEIKHQGQFGAAARDKLGRRVRGPRVISYFDTEEGRYLQVRKEDPYGGESWTTISPTDHRRLLQQLTDLETEVARLVER